MSAPRSPSFDPLQDLLLEAKADLLNSPFSLEDLSDPEVKQEYVKSMTVLAQMILAVERMPSTKNQQLLRSAIDHIRYTRKELTGVIIRRAFEVREKKERRSRKV